MANAKGQAPTRYGMDLRELFLHNSQDHIGLLAFSDFVSPTSSYADGALIDIGLQVNRTSNASVANGTDALNGRVNLLTSAQANEEVSFGVRGIRTSNDPGFVCKVQSSVAGAGLKGQAWGFHEDVSLANIADATKEKALFRSVTTGALFAVTGGGSSETTTSLASVHTLNTAATYEVRVTSSGTLVEFFIDGVLVASHTANLPSASQDLFAVCGITNNTTTLFTLTELDYMAVAQQRLL
tara:strand:+ start:6336 stop:7055 length:720 start_codon:yes stop_codon:yes gene_type:complete